MTTNESLRNLWIASGYKSDMASAIAGAPPTDQGTIRLYNLNKTEHALNNIENSRLKVSTFQDLNDPFELLAANFKEYSARLLVRNWKDRTSQETGLLCFSADWGEPVMWSHYADRHRGICLGFNVRRDLVKKVSYRADRILHRLDTEEDPGRLPEKLKKQLLYTKSANWSYEEEYRALINLKDTNTENNLQFINLNKDIELAEVILGPLCQESISKVRRFVHSKHPNALVYKARLAFRSFKIVPNKESIKSSHL